MKLVHINSVGGDLYVVREHHAAVDPGYGMGVGGHPDQGLPGQGHIDNSLPGGAGHPDNRPPGNPPAVTEPGAVLVLMRDPMGVWHYATIAPGSPPPRPVPVPPPAVGPGNPNLPNQGLPGGPPGHVAPPMAPGAAPKR
jgi:hypothetical protein